MPMLKLDENLENAMQWFQVFEKKFFKVFPLSRYTKYKIFELYLSTPRSIDRSMSTKLLEQLQVGTEVVSRGQKWDFLQLPLSSFHHLPPLSGI